MRISQVVLLTSLLALPSCKKDKATGEGTVPDQDALVVATPEEPAPRRLPVVLPTVAAARARPVGEPALFVLIEATGVRRVGVMPPPAEEPSWQGQLVPDQLALWDALEAVERGEDLDDLVPEEPKPGLGGERTGEGQFRMRDDDQAAREEAIKAAREAGILGDAPLEQGDSFSSLTGTGDIDSGFDQPPEGVGRLDDPPRTAVLVLADAAAPARPLVAAFDSGWDMVLGVDGGAGLARFQVWFAAADEIAAVPPLDAEVLVVDLTDQDAALHGSVRRFGRAAWSGGAVDRAALATAHQAARADASLKDSTEVVVAVDDKVTVGQLVGVLDALVEQGATQLVVRDYQAPPAGPQVRVGAPSAVGELAKDVIRATVRTHLAKITACYEKQLVEQPDLQGTVTVQFFIAPNGKVVSSNAAGLDKKVDSCVAAVIKKIVFPKPEGGGGVQVNYPFLFRPALEP